MLRTWLLEVSFKVSVLDPCVFFRGNGFITWLYVHVDDIGIFGSNIQAFKDELSREFKIKDVGKVDLMLGIKVIHLNYGITLDQHHFCESLLKLYGMSACQPFTTPLIPNLHLKKASPEEKLAFKALGINYCRIIGSLSYLSTATRPDLLHAVSTLSQYLEDPESEDWRSFLHVLCYLWGTPDFWLSYSHGDDGIIGYSDADWGNCQDTQRLVTGYLDTLDRNIIIWKMRKQTSVSISTTEAGYKALCDLTSELLWLRQWCLECQVLEIKSPILVLDNNQSCINTANGDCKINNKQIKHVDIQLPLSRR
ncbi:hypothetical protein O181_025316 [Austropuccinia psidii MF-1]|uniref:Reverse transcriptase Ty1/copia-type domain-containing protein n=1 Tax=Austropuccinia psidii MF-1 TaxID=1389203 RepID=A0A9Q3CN67_9BASI|nr:hypothetical protein [Austropuccinia psidii MF-1]